MIVIFYLMLRCYKVFPLKSRTIQGHPFSLLFNVVLEVLVILGKQKKKKKKKLKIQKDWKRRNKIITICRSCDYLHRKPKKSTNYYIRASSKFTKYNANL